MIKKYSGQIIGFFSAIIFFMLLAYIVKPSSEALKNENSFRVRGKFTYQNNLQYIGNLDINCKNKDFYFRPKGV